MLPCRVPGLLRTYFRVEFVVVEDVIFLALNQKLFFNGEIWLHLQRSSKILYITYLILFVYSYLLFNSYWPQIDSTQGMDTATQTQHQKKYTWLSNWLITFRKLSHLVLFGQLPSDLYIVVHSLKKHLKTAKFALKPHQSQHFQSNFTPIKLLLKFMVNIHLHQLLQTIFVMRIPPYRSYPKIPHTFQHNRSQVNSVRLVPQRLFRLRVYLKIGCRKTQLFFCQTFPVNDGSREQPTVRDWDVRVPVRVLLIVGRTAERNFVYFVLGRKKQTWKWFRCVL